MGGGEESSRCAAWLTESFIRVTLLVSGPVSCHTGTHIYKYTHTHTHTHIYIYMYSQTLVKTANKEGGCRKKWRSITKRKKH